MLENGGALQSIEAMCKDMDSGAELVESCPVAPDSPSAGEAAERRRSVSTDDSGSGSDESGGSSTGRRPARTVFSAAQMAALEREYAANRYLSTPQRRQLSRQLQLAESTVKVWFQNRRMKEKRQQSESQMHYLSQVMHNYMFQLHCAGVVPPLAPAGSLPMSAVTSAHMTSPVMPAAQVPTAPLTPPLALPSGQALPLVGCSGEMTSPLMSPPGPMPSPVDLCRPRTRPHAHLFRPYAL